LLSSDSAAASVQPALECVDKDECHCVSVLDSKW
jgi:hypothetical protein